MYHPDFQSDKLAKQRSRWLRNNMTKPEKILWKVLRKRCCCSTKFRRQVPIGRYVVDFFSPSRRLVIEVDGVSHLSPIAREHDATRTEFLQQRGLRVLRFSNEQITKSLSQVSLEIDTYLKQT